MATNWEAVARALYREFADYSAADPEGADVTPLEWFMKRHGGGAPAAACECAALRARAERAEEALRVTVAALEAVEWADNSGDEYTAECPWCEADGPVPPSWRKSLPDETDGKHRDDCQRQAALAAARTVAVQPEPSPPVATETDRQRLLKSEPDPAETVAAFFAEKEGR